MGTSCLVTMKQTHAQSSRLPLQNTSQKCHGSLIPPSAPLHPFTFSRYILRAQPFLIRRTCWQAVHIQHCAIQVSSKIVQIVAYNSNTVNVPRCIYYATTSTIYLPFSNTNEADVYKWSILSILFKGLSSEGSIWHNERYKANSQVMKYMQGFMS